MRFFQAFFRFFGASLVFVLVFINTDQGKQFVTEMGIPIQNNTIREILAVDLDESLTPEEQLRDLRPIYGVFDLPSALFIFFSLFAYIILSFNISEIRFVSAHMFSSASKSKRALDNLINKMKHLSETYYNSGSEAIRGVTGKDSIPHVWNVVIEQIEMRIPFEDILMIVGNSAALTRKNYDRNIKIISTLSNIAPSFGVMGTVLGLMNVLVNLNDHAGLGPSMSLALLTTFYGLFLSVIVFKPFLTHLENMKAIEMNSYQAASFWLKNLAFNKPSFYLDQIIQKTH